MWSSENDRPKGYEYPKPTTEIGRTNQQTPAGKVIPLSRESVNKFRESVRRNEERSGAEAMAARRCR